MLASFINNKVIKIDGEGFGHPIWLEPNRDDNLDLFPSPFCTFIEFLSICICPPPATLRAIPKIAFDYGT
jgi:hypothetical protein